MKLTGVAIITVGLASQAFGHFVWAGIRPEGGRKVVLSFSEAPGEDVLPIMGRLAPKVKFLGGTAGPRFGPGVAQGDLVAFPLGKPTPAALAYVPYGVVDRGGAVYGLDYYAKAVVAPTDASRIVGQGFEIVAVPKESTWMLTAYVDGKPVRDAQLFLGREESEVKGVPGQTMEIPMSPDKPLHVRAVREIARAGKADGKSFTKTKEWTSLTLPVAPKISEGSDPNAYRALEIASESRESLWAGTPGFSVAFNATNGTDRLKGDVRWPGTGAATITFPGEENSYTKHVRGQLGSLFMHRLSRPFGEGDGKAPITWTVDTNELGRQMLVKDRFDSSYRLKDGKIRQVVRTLGKGRLTLDILETKETTGGRYLTTRFRSVEKSVADGSLRHDLIYVDEFRLENGEWMPAKRRVEGTADGERIIMEVTFGKYQSLTAVK